MFEILLCWSSVGRERGLQDQHRGGNAALALGPGPGTGRRLGPCISSSTLVLEVAHGRAGGRLSSKIRIPNAESLMIGPPRDSTDEWLVQNRSILLTLVLT